MRPLLILTLLTSLSFFGCGNTTKDPVLEPSTEIQTAETAGGMMAGGKHDMGLNTEVTLSEEVSAAWRGAIIQVTAPDENIQQFDLPLDEAVTLGDTGLTATALVFVPDFVMDEGGISTRSPEAKNPALKLRVTEEGKPDYEGWLFAAMPEIHPFPHETYSIVLIGGLPVE